MAVPVVHQPVSVQLSLGVREEGLGLHRLQEGAGGRAGGPGGHQKSQEGVGRAALPRLN